MSAPGAAAPPTQCYVYYRVGPDDLAACLAAARHAQAALRRAMPGLQARLLQSAPRADDALPTLMEVYICADDAQLTEVQARMQAALARWIVGTRHLERFVAADD